MGVSESYEGCRYDHLKCAALSSVSMVILIVIDTRPFNEASLLWLFHSASCGGSLAKGKVAPKHWSIWVSYICISFRVQNEITTTIALVGVVNNKLELRGNFHPPCCFAAGSVMPSGRPEAAWLSVIECDWRCSLVVVGHAPPPSPRWITGKVE